MKYEKPQKGNPHNLTVKQHIFPYKSIERFTNTDGRVELKNLITCNLLHVKPDNEIFCARRAWNQWAESGYMKIIEDKFQEIADRIVADPDGIIFSSTDKMWIDRFYRLWVVRFKHKKNPEKDEKMFSKGSGYSLDEQEQLEKAGFMFTKDNGSYAGRDFAATMIRDEISDICMMIKEAQWEVLRSTNLEFVVPDHPFDFLAIPITPRLCLYSKSKNVVVSDELINFLNKKMIESSFYYYFARDLTKCLIGYD